MCTVTIVPHHDGFRLVCNRDERRDRPAATPPTVHRLQHRTPIYPVVPFLSLFFGTFPFRRFRGQGSGLLQVLGISGCLTPDP
jgi:hypothetical protein